MVDLGAIRAPLLMHSNIVIELPYIFLETIRSTVYKLKNGRNIFARPDNRKKLLEQTIKTQHRELTRWSF
ncbi:hypothetical protein ACQ0P8_03845 [Halodesulfovibrio aestuarii]|uniref:Uncharacterized protein n=1 Tax=Halodesulfovibrio aestuarii TaxID=126333 RepID=A0A8G2C8Q1_9BACT|nr:hypothetical protein [Halodesulfovibrio aestuarii]SHI72943.1 hypothetical protein SAMN05660830_00797 [Halodesulfovibrio aestuarii]